MATTDSEYFYRLSSLLVDVGTEVLRKRFLNFLSNYSQTLVQFLQYHQQIISNLQKRRVLRQDQLVLLHPPSGQPGDPTQWDISLLCILLINLCPISSQERRCIESLRSSRNVVYGHIGKATITKAEFRTRWNEITTHVKDLAKTFNDTAFERRLKERIDRLNEGPLDVGTSASLLRDWYIQDQQIESHIDGIGSTLERISAQTKDIASKETSPPDHVFINLQNHTRSLMLDKCKAPYTIFQQYSRALQRVQLTGMVTISGKPGEGKTLAAVKLMEELAPVEQCLIVYNPSHIDHIDMDQVSVLLIDDILGKHQLDRGKLAEWLPKFQLLQTMIDSGKIKLIMTSRRNILLQGMVELSEYKMFKNCVEFSSDLLSLEERQDILKGLLRWHKRDESQIDINACCEKFKSPIGFPYSAFLFSSNPDLFTKKEAFFKRPLEFFKEAVGALESDKLIALLFVFYKENDVKENELRATRKNANEENTSLLRHISSLVGVNPTKMSLQVLRECLNQLNGVYFSHAGNTFSFAHNTIYECVALIFAETQPEEVILHCSNDFLHQCITTECTSEGTSLVVEEDRFEVLAERLVNDVVNKKHRMHRISNHGSLRNAEFCQALYKYSEHSNHLQEFLSTSLQKDESRVGVQSGILRVYLQGHTLKEELYLVFEGIERLSCSKACLLGTCWKCDVKRDTMSGACFGGHPGVFQRLIQSKTEVTQQHIHDAAIGKNIDVVLGVCSSLKASGNFDPESSYTSKALVEARQYLDQTIVSALLNGGAVYTSLCVNDFVVMGNLDAVKEAVSSLKASGKWNLTDFWLQTSIASAIEHKHMSIYEYLESEGLMEGSGGLRSAVLRNNVDLVKRIIAKMKASGSWRTTDKYSLGGRVRQMLSRMDTRPVDMAPFNLSEHVPGLADREMAEVLVAARRLTDKTIYALLTSEGLHLTMGTLKWAVESRNQKFVEDVIVELESTQKWTPHSKDAGLALVAAQKKGLKEIEELLKAHGVALSMDVLTSVFSTKKDIDYTIQVIENLISIGEWNPQHIALHYIFVESFQLKDKKLYDFLISKGVTVKFTTLVFAMSKGDLNNFRALLEAMKNQPNWNPSDAGLVSCLTFSKFMNPAVHKMLREAGVGFSSKTFLRAAINNDKVSIMSAMETLMNEGKWSPKGDKDIEKGLEYLCLHGNLIMYSISVKKGAVPTKRCIQNVIEGKSIHVFNTTMRCKRVAVPSLSSLCTAHLAEYCFDYVAQGSLYCMWKCICALVECGRWEPSGKKATKAMEKACRLGNIIVHNTLAETGVQPSLDCIFVLIQRFARTFKEGIPISLKQQAHATVLYQCIIKAVKLKKLDILNGAIAFAVAYNIWNPDDDKLRDAIANEEKSPATDILVAAGVFCPCVLEGGNDAESVKDVGGSSADAADFAGQTVTEAIQEDTVDDTTIIYSRTRSENVSLSECEDVDVLDEGMDPTCD